jgi:excisionase family DNA binding protein
LSEKLLTTAQVAEILQVIPSTVISYIKETEHPLPAIFLGKRGGYRIAQKDLDQWIEERKKRQGD